ncbi:hypothetical protein PO909_015763 [Leuciscus waleckii]
MKSVLPVKMLSALALVLLVSSATEGRILSKCELKAELEAAQIKMKPFNPHSSEPEIQRPVRQLYGVFQLSDQLACDSGMMPSLNVCKMSCSALIDDDITDDIACLKTMIDSM